MMRVRFLGILGWLIAILLMGVVAILAWQLDRRLDIEAGLRADVGGLSIHRGREAASSPCVVIIGDSRATALGEPDIDGWSVINLGVPGQTTAEILARAGRDLVLLRPDAVVLITGINDLKSGESEDAIDQAAAATRDIIQVTASLGQPTMMIETWPQANLGVRTLLLPQDLPERCLRLADDLKSHPDTQKADFITIQQLLGEDGLVRTEFARDALHLNQAGQQLLVDAIKAFLGSDPVVGS